MDSKKYKRVIRAWQDSNLQSPDPKSGALSIRPHTHMPMKEGVSPTYGIYIYCNLECNPLYSWRKENVPLISWKGIDTAFS